MLFCLAFGCQSVVLLETCGGGYTEQCFTVQRKKLKPYAHILIGHPGPGHLSFYFESSLNITWEDIELTDFWNLVCRLVNYSDDYEQVRSAEPSFIWVVSQLYPERSVWVSGQLLFIAKPFSSSHYVKSPPPEKRNVEVVLWNREKHGPENDAWALLFSSALNFLWR